nr:hypothetical protein [Tanacetum cinerariifolium]
MATTIDQQVALDEALVPSMQRLRIGRSNFRLPSDIQSKESTLQVVYDILRNSPFFRAFQMDTKKSVLDLEAFREMLHTSPRIPSQSFAELPSKEEILEFLSDQQVPDWQKLWHRQFQIVSSTNSMRILSQNQLIIDYFMIRKPSISRRNRINSHYVRDDVLFSTIKVVSRHHTTQQYGTILSIELTTDDIINSKAYKEYYACAMREAAPKPVLPQIHESHH